MVRRAGSLAFAAVLGLIGLVLILGGARLVQLGGSAYYLAAGLTVAASAVLRLRASVWADRAYALMLVGTAIWALFEAGLAPWGLVSRLLGPALLGLLFLFFVPPAPSAVARVSPSAVAGLLCLLLVTGAFFAPGAFFAGGPARQPPAAASAPADTDWLHYGNDLRGSRFAPLTQITRGNVAKLQVAWVHRSGAPQQPWGSGEATPIKVGDVLYTCTPNSVVIALDARTGHELWRHDPKALPGPYATATCRGVSYARVAPGEAPCAGRILTTTIDNRLLALDARTGRRCLGFGSDGQVSLQDGLGPVVPGAQYPSAAPLVTKGHIVLGSFVLDSQSTDVASGVIRSFDVVTGAMQWAWDMGAPDRAGSPPPGETYTRSTPNAWATLAADESLNLVYVPLGNPSPDFFGGLRRPFDEAYGSALVALDLDTGRPRWSFQAMHHDLWDMDLAAQPLLVEISRPEGRIPAVVQVTKQGDVYVLDRRNGRPILPVTERPAPRGVAAGDALSPTQPSSPLVIGRTRLTEAAMWGLTPLDQMACRIQFRGARYEGRYTPPATGKRTIVYPGYSGVTDWGGLSIDPDRNIAVINTTNFGWWIRLVPRKQITPELKASHWSPMMTGTPYGVDMGPLMGPLEVPCNAPPWGELEAVDLNTGRGVWKRALGTGRDSGPFGVASQLPLPIGVPSQAGAVTTRGGIVFIGATLDRYLRAFDLTTGDELWKARLPAGGQATPMTYMAGGRQYVVITAQGNAHLRTTPGDYTIAFALPNAGASAGHP